jgi:hypothetical protein
MAPRQLYPDDAVWAAELMERRRQEYARYSPVFWRPAKDVVGLHARFLARQISSDTNIALRTEHGFIICQRRATEGFVDDFAVEHPETWADDGAALLLTVASRLSAMRGNVGAIRVVSAHADQPKDSMLRSLSLHLAEQWWVLELRPGSDQAAPHRVQGPGFGGIFGPAPPVYDPGGPVLLVDRLDEDAEVAAVEREAAARGAVLAIVPATPGTARAGELRRQGWNVASDWYLGWPIAATGG